MRKVFCIIAILASILTMISTLRSDNDVSNEMVEMHKIYIWGGTVWKEQMSGADQEGKLTTLAEVSAEQNEFEHALSADASFGSDYEEANITGTYHLRAKLKHAWATDEPPFEERGQIKGKQGGMYKSGDQSDRDWFRYADPSITIHDCDAYAEAKVYPPNEVIHFKAVAEAPIGIFSPIWLRKSPGDNSPDDEDDVIDFRDLTPDDEEEDTPAPPPYTIYLADSDQTPSPGDSVTLNLVTDSAYYSIDWYVKSPSETSERGTYQQYDYGDGTSTEASLSYTFPSGSMHTGDYLITAVIYRYSNMSSYEETYTVNVSDSSSSTTSAPTDNTPDCSYCTDGCSSCQTSTTDSDDDDTDDTSTTQSSGVYPTNGSYTASAGDTHNATGVTSTPYTYVAWSVNGFLWETDSGDGTATEASFSYTFPNDASGDYVISVEVQTGTYYTDSYTVTIP